MKSVGIVEEESIGSYIKAVHQQSAEKPNKISSNI